MLTPKGVSSFSTGSPDVLLVSMGTQGRKDRLWHTLCLLYRLPTLAPADPSKIRLTVPPAPAAAPGTRQNLPSSLGYSPTGEKETAAGGRRESNQMGKRAVRPLPPLGLIPSWVGVGWGGGAAGPQGRRCTWPFSSWARDALVRGSLFSQPK